MGTLRPKYVYHKGTWSLRVWGQSVGCVRGFGSQSLQNPSNKESTLNHIRDPIII